MFIGEIRGSHRDKSGGIVSCKCLPSCNTIDYEAEISLADYYWDRDTSFPPNLKSQK
jgi:hypothetical protein